MFVWGVPGGIRSGNRRGSGPRHYRASRDGAARADRESGRQACCGETVRRGAARRRDGGAVSDAGDSGRERTGGGDRQRGFDRDRQVGGVCQMGAGGIGDGDGRRSGGGCCRTARNRAAGTYGETRGQACCGERVRRGAARGRHGGVVGGAGESARQTSSPPRQRSFFPTTKV